MNASQGLWVGCLWQTAAASSQTTEEPQAAEPQLSAIPESVSEDTKLA